LTVPISPDYSAAIVVIGFALPRYVCDAGIFGFERVAVALLGCLKLLIKALSFLTTSPITCIVIVRGWTLISDNMFSSNHEELFMLGRIMWTLVLTLLTLAYLTVGLRLWVRFRITKSAGWDDAAMVATLVGLSQVSFIRTNTDCRSCSSPVTAASSSS
jgi:hypothetical protein